MVPVIRSGGGWVGRWSRRRLGGWVSVVIHSCPTVRVPWEIAMLLLPGMEGGFLPLGAGIA